MRDVAGASEQTRARVQPGGRRDRYRPDPRARRLRQHRTKLIGVTFTAGQEFHADLVDGVYVAAEALGYDVVLSAVTPHRDEARALRTLVDDRCEGLVLIGPQLPDARARRSRGTGARGGGGPPGARCRCRA